MKMPRTTPTARQARSTTCALATCVLALGVTIGCGPSKEAKHPNPGDPAALAKATAHALEIEATHPASEALDAWVQVLEMARDVRGTPLAREAALAAIDAISGRNVLGLEGLGSGIGAASRVAGGQKRAAAALDATLDSDGATDPMLRVMAANARLAIAGQLGDAAGVVAMQKASGCAMEATIVGPFVGGSLGALSDAGPVDGGALAATYPPPATAGNAALALGTSATTASGGGCTLDITGSAVGSGLRYAVIDVDVPSAQTIALGVESQLPLQLLVAGKPVMALAYGELGERTTRFGHVEVKGAGTLRLVVKIAAYDPSELVVYALGEDGTPLVSRAAPMGAPPSLEIGAMGAERSAASQTTVEGKVTVALGQLASGDVKLAEETIAEVARPTAATKAKTPPGAALVYARAIAFASDLPSVRRLERLRAAYESVLDGWPSSWEAIVAHAQIVSEQRRGGAGEIEAISEARKRRDAAGASADPLIDAFLAFIGDDIYGVKEDSLARARPRLKDTLIGWRLDRGVAEETADVRAKIECDPARPDVGGYDCAMAKQAIGDEKALLAEIARLRALYNEPSFGQSSEMHAVLKESGIAATKALYDKAPVSERDTGLAVQLTPAGKDGLTWLRHELRTLDGDGRAIAEVLNARRAAGDASAGADLSSPYEARTRALMAADLANKQMVGSGTVILDREEKYELDADGFMHAVVWELRRLDGSADIDSNASARVASTSSGHGYISQTTHRVFKSDGQIIEPDRIAAAQAGADLAQIQVGDYVELLAEGWMSPRVDGTFDLDTADLLPQRTGVVHATIDLSVPSSVPFDVWSHEELGKPATTDAGGVKHMVWTVKNHDVRRSEKGQAQLDSSVSVRMSTWAWSRLGRDAREGIIADEEHNFEVSQWVSTAIGADRSPTLDLLARVEKAVKRALPRVGYLPLGGGEYGLQSYTARTVLLDAQGSRVELMHRALDEAGVKNEVVWAEQTPYSADPKMVARFWRFSHALLIAYVADKAGSELKPTWLDLDVDGYPPPPGRTSPELRGRSAINTKGEIIPIPANPSDDPDTATIDLTVDDTGRAKGTITLLLRGREAQDVEGVLEEMAGDQRDDALREFVMAWMPEADVTDVSASSETWQVLLKANVEVPSMLVPDGKRFAIAGSPPLHYGGRAGTLGATYASQAQRTTALTIQNAILYSMHRVVRMPAGTSISTPLPSVDVTDAATAMHATRSAKVVDGTTLVEDVTFSLPTGVVAVSQFGAFTASARAIDDGFESVVRVVPAPGMMMTVPTTKAAEKSKKP